MSDDYDTIERDFNAFLCHSSKKRNQWECAQEKCEVNPLMIKTPVRTRFLNKLDCMIRLFERWTPAEVFFGATCDTGNTQLDTQPERKEEKFTGENKLREFFSDRRNRVFYLFMMTVLEKYQEANLAMQRERREIRKESSILGDLYRDILLIYVDREYIKNTRLMDVDPDDQSHWKPLGHISLKKKVREELKEHLKTNDDERDFFVKCQKYVVGLARNLRKRCEMDIDGSHHDNCLYPSNALDEDFHLKKYPNLDKLLQSRPQLINFGDPDEKNDINKEWALLSSVENLPDDIKEEDRVERFWNKIYNYKDADDNFLFKKLGIFMIKYLIIPHSNAYSERIWSRLKRQKTLKRASLQFASIRAIMLSYQYSRCWFDEF